MSNRLQIKPLTLKQANAMVGEWHRHHKEAQGLRWAIGAVVGTRMVGAVICGRPLARMSDQYMLLEATRCVTDGYRNGCSKLYSTAARIADEMGFDEIQTFVLESESGVSLKAAGWTLDVNEDGNPVKHGGGTWNRPSRKGRRDDQPQEMKHKWYRKFLKKAA